MLCSKFSRGNTTILEFKVSKGCKSILSDLIRYLNCFSGSWELSLSLIDLILRLLNKATTQTDTSETCGTVRQT